MITIKDVEKAYKRITNYVVNTPCQYSNALSDLLSAKVYLKLDHLQRTGSFKERGALNCLLSLSAEEKKGGVVTASAGNHGQAVAYHSTRLNIKSTVFMALNTPVVKINKTENYGATICLIGDNYDDAHKAALQFASKNGAYYVHAYDSETVIAGQGTVALELHLQLPQIDKIIVPVGGGGLISGIGVVYEAVSPKTELIGVEPALLPSMSRAIQKKKPIKMKAAHSIADGIKVRKVGSLTYEICSRLVKEWVLVDDNQVAEAILFLMEQEKTVVEGAGAAGVAAILSDRLNDLKGKTICIVIGGGNIDPNFLAQIIERGMIEAGRLIRLKVKIKDQPGKLSELLQVIGQTAANVMEVRHERAFISAFWSEIEVDLVLQTRNKKHIDEILLLLNMKGYAV